MDMARSGPQVDDLAGSTTIAQRHMLIPGWKLLLGRLHAVLALLPVLCYVSMALQSSLMSMADSAPFLLDEDPPAVNNVLVASSDIVQDVAWWNHGVT
eukprot:2947039-Amphidinium_carterae.1